MDNKMTVFNDNDKLDSQFKRKNTDAKYSQQFDNKLANRFPVLSVL